MEDELWTSSAHAVAYKEGMHKIVIANHPTGLTFAVVTESHSKSVHSGEDGPRHRSKAGSTYNSTGFIRLLQ